jgi:dTDP-4-amino-4,6-dideoxygalactose transaminase
MLIANRFGLDAIEDAAQSHNGACQGKMTGSIGTAGCFSFYLGKNRGAAGDAGALASHYPRRLERYRRLRGYGQSSKYHHGELVLNARLESIQVSILSIKLPYLSKWNDDRIAVANIYTNESCDVGDFDLPKRLSGSDHGYHLYLFAPITETSYFAFYIHNPEAIHEHPAYRALGYAIRDFPVAESIAETCISLPIFPRMTLSQVLQVVSIAKHASVSIHGFNKLKASNCGPRLRLLGPKSREGL